MPENSINENASLEALAQQRDEARQQAESEAAQKLLQEMKEKETAHAESDAEKRRIHEEAEAERRAKWQGMKKSSLHGRRRSAYPMSSLWRTLSSVSEI